jgi:hypothetical protein
MHPDAPPPAQQGQERERPVQELGPVLAQERVQELVQERVQERERVRVAV